MSNAQTYPSIKCNEEINGATTANDTTHYYSFNSDNNTIITINACKSNYRNYLMLYRYDTNQTDFVGPVQVNGCPIYGTSSRTYGPLMRGDYLVAITGGDYYRSFYGDYAIQLSCYHRDIKTQCMLDSFDPRNDIFDDDTSDRFC